MTRLPLKDRQKQLREEMILEIAHELMTTKGVQAMTMDEVAAAVKISKATLYAHFKSKEDLIVSVINRKIREFVDLIQSLEPSLPTLVKLSRTMTWIIAKRFGKEGVPMLDAESSLMSDASILAYLKTHPEYRRHEKILTNVLTRLLDEAQTEGYIPPQFSTGFMAQMLLSCLCDASYEIMLREGQCTLDDMTRTLVGMLCCAASPAELDAALSASDIALPITH